MRFVWEASRVVGTMWLPQPRIDKNRTYSSHREHVSTPQCHLYTEVITQHLHAAIMGEVTVWKLPSIGTWRRGTLLKGTLENVLAPTAIRPISNVSTQTRWGWNPRNMNWSFWFFFFNGQWSTVLMRVGGSFHSLGPAAGKTVSRLSFHLDLDTSRSN